jgi:hypothetical protein
LITNPIWAVIGVDGAPIGWWRQSGTRVAAYMKGQRDAGKPRRTTKRKR